MQQKKIKEEEHVICCDNQFTASKNDKGIWIYKSNPGAFKFNAKVLKKKLHDLPRFKVILQYEKAFKNECDDYLKNLTLNIVKAMKRIVKK